MPPRKVFLNLVMQREGYMAVWYVLVLSCDSCHDNKSHVHFLEWMVCLQTYKECYQIWQVWNDDMPGNPGAWAEWMLRLASQNLLLVRSGRKTDAPSGFVSCFSVLFFFLIWFGVFWRVTWEFQTEFVRWTEEKKKSICSLCAVTLKIPMFWILPVFLVRASGNPEGRVSSIL